MQVAQKTAGGRGLFSIQGCELRIIAFPSDCMFHVISPINF